MYSGLLAALFIALLITAIAVMLFRRKGPWGTAWSFFLVLFLALWTVSLYVRSIGPVYWDVAWLPLILVGILLALLLAATIPAANYQRGEGKTETGKITDVPETGVGKFFWILIILFIAAIIVGMVNPQMAL